MLRNDVGVSSLWRFVSSKSTWLNENGVSASGGSITKINWGAS